MAAFLLLACISYAIHSVSSNPDVHVFTKTKHNMQQILLKDLFRYYDKDVHPEGDKPVIVTFGAKLGKITNVDERNNVIQAQWYVRQTWVNKGLAWNSSEYGGIDKLHVQPHRIWIPDLVLYNNADPKIDTAGGTDKFRTKIEITHNGTAKWLAPAMFHSVCNMDIRYFPFDEQHCNLQFASWAYDVSRLKLEIDEQETRVLEGFSSKEWEIPYLYAVKHLVNYTCCPHPYGDVTINLALIRRPFYYVVNMIFPCSLIACMTFLTFLLPVESGERISLCITVLMAMSIFQELTSQKLPPSSEAFFLLGVYYTVTITAIGLGLASTCVIINFYYRETCMSLWMKALLLGKLPDILGIERTYLKTNNNSDKKSNMVPKSPGWAKNDPQICRSTEVILQGITKLEQQSEDIEKDKSETMENGQGPVGEPSSPCVLQRKTKKPSTKTTSGENISSKDEESLKLWQEQWKTASRVVDRLVLIIGLLLGFGSAAAIFLQAPRIRALFWS